MSTINSTSNINNVYTQNTTQVSNAQAKRGHHHHKKADAKDATQFSKEGLQALGSLTQGQSGTGPKNPLDSLVANGTITQDQENSIKSAFQSARQANVSGAYGSKPTNPISTLIANGTITQDQADAIKSSFQSMNKSASGVHHHHHHAQQAQGVSGVGETAAQASQAAEQALENSQETSNS